MERNNVGVFRKIIEVLCPSEILARALVGNVTRQCYDVHFISLGYVGYGSADFPKPTMPIVLPESSVSGFSKAKVGAI